VWTIHAVRVMRHNWARRRGPRILSPAVRTVEEEDSACVTAFAASFPHLRRCGFPFCSWEKKASPPYPDRDSRRLIEFKISCDETRRSEPMRRTEAS